MRDSTPAGFLLRFAAFIIDTLMFFLFVSVPVSLTMGSVMIASGGALNWPNILVGYILPFGLTIWFWQKYLGTPGKMLLGIRVVDAASGEKPTVTKSVMRYFAYIISIIPLGLGFFWILFDEKKRGFHDHLSGTSVIRDVPGYSRSNK